MKEKDYKKQGIIGTIVYHSIILLLLLFFGMQSIIEEEEGLLVNFGNSETGYGAEELRQSQSESVQESQPITPPPPQSQPEIAEPNTENVNTQDFEEAAALKEEQKKKQEQERIEKERKRQQQLEAQRKKEAEERKKRAEAEAERKRQEELARQKAEANSRVKNAFGSSSSGSNSSSEGNTSGSGNQGYVTGDPNSKNRTGSGQGSTGIGYSLSGRSPIGSLPKPGYSIQEEGIVVVQIRVDKSGKVTQATPILKGSTTQNSTLWDLARKAALKAKFNTDSNAPIFQEGTITYHFVLD